MRPNFLILLTCLCQAWTFQPLTKEEQLEKIKKMDETVEPFRRNLTECGRQVRASKSDMEAFMKRIPQTSMEGKCLVACLFKRTGIIRNNKLQVDTLIAQNENAYGSDKESLKRLKLAIDTCGESVKDIFEICEFASTFNDCMLMSMEHVLERLTLERKVHALEEVEKSRQEDDDDDMMLIRDEL